VEFSDPLGEVMPDNTGWLGQAVISVPITFGRLPDGRPTVQIGDILGCAAFNHLQGDNPEHERGDCGIVCCADVLNQFGFRWNEADVVRHATDCRELHVVAADPARSGWTQPTEVARILTDYGVSSHPAQGQSIEQLAADVQRGHGVIAAVNAGVLWSEARALGHGQANHAITVTGIAREPYDGALQGFYINDSGSGLSAQFVSAHLMITAFVRTGGFCVVTDEAHSARLAG
jgi:peptidase C39-like protein